MRNQSGLNDLSMFPQRRQTAALAWSPSTQAACDHATGAATNRILAPRAAARRRFSCLGNTAGAYKAVSDQSILLIANGLRHAGLAQPIIVAVDAHIAAEGMHGSYEGDRKVRPPLGHLGQITLRFVVAAKLAQSRDEHRVARPLKARLCQSPQ